MRSLRIICPNGHLGFAPIRVDSFRLGVAARPDYIAADSGSDDVGPVPLGADTSTSPLAWQTHDLELMLLAARDLGEPMIIGSAGDTGATYERVKRSGVLTRESVCALYRIPLARLADFVEFDPGNAIKFTIYRLRPSGSPGDPDIFGAQQYAPLLDIQVPPG